jgi:hypothetical protein
MRINGAVRYSTFKGTTSANPLGISSPNVTCTKAPKLIASAPEYAAIRG